jgi:uncharacterized protein (TIGR02271 family)
MWSENEAREALGKTVYSQEGDKIGKVGQVFLDDQSGAPEFLTVNTGLFGTSESFVPVDGASIQGDNVTVPYGKDKVKDAPRVDLDGDHLDESDERRLYEYYGRGYDTTGTTDTARTTDTAGVAGSAGRGDSTDYRSGDSDRVGDSYAAADSGRAGDSDRVGDSGRTGDNYETADARESVSAGHRGSEGHDTSGPNTDEAMTRSEEHLDVGTTTQAAGRARLRKYVTTENETVTVPVQRERAVLETEPVDASNIDNATEGPAISEEEHEVVLNEERVVVDKVATPVERVRLGTETVTEQETVSEEVRKENIEVEGDVDKRNAPGHGANTSPRPWNQENAQP